MKSIVVPKGVLAFRSRLPAAIRTLCGCQPWEVNEGWGVLVGLGPGVIVKVGWEVGVKEGIWVGMGCNVLVCEGMVVLGLPVGAGEGVPWHAAKPRRMITRRE